MTDLEKVLLGLECCAAGSGCVGKCPYGGEDADIYECTGVLAAETLTLLKSLKQKNDECEKCAEKTSTAIQRLQEQLKEARGK